MSFNIYRYIQLSQKTLKIKEDKRHRTFKSINSQTKKIACIFPNINLTNQLIDIIIIDIYDESINSSKMYIGL